MKNKAICPVILMTAFLLLLVGCGALEKNLGILQSRTQRSVENNLFASTFPEIKLQIGQDLKYLGTVRLAESVEGRHSDNIDRDERTFDANAYLFGYIGPDSRIAKGVLIRVLVMYGDPSQVVPEIFLKTGANKLESGDMKILETQYQYDLYTESELLTPKEKDLLKGKVPPCLLVKQLSSRFGLGYKSRIQILYFEDLTGVCGSQRCGACLDSRDRTEEQKRYIKEFTDRSYASTRFLKTRMVEDTTSRYVDVDPKAQPAPAKVPPSAPIERLPPAPVEKVRPKPMPVEKTPPAPVEKIRPAPAEKAPAPVEPGRTDPTGTIEKRLETLKRLYENKLISTEDYEKKKAEILKEL